MKLKLTILITLTLMLVSCAPTKGPILTPLEIQTMQTREYEENKKIVFPSVISVFQDLGYTITNADIETGLITAESSAQNIINLEAWLGVTNVSQTKATGFIEEIGEITKARLNFVVTTKKSYAYGQTQRNDVPVLDVKTYESAFDKIENAIFIRLSN